MDLAVKLGLPLLAPHPSIARHFSLKSGAKQLFRSAKVNVPPGVEVDPRPTGPHHTFGENPMLPQSSTRVQGEGVCHGYITDNNYITDIHVGPFYRYNASLYGVEILAAWLYISCPELNLD